MRGVDHRVRPHRSTADERCALDEGWLTRRAGPVALRFRPHSYAARDADDLADRYADAVREVVRALDVEALGLPAITVYVTDAPQPVGPTPDDGDRPSSTLVIRAVHAPEAPCPAPELDLIPALLSHYLGAPTPAARFWDAGLAGYLAGRSGRCPYHADASAR